MTNFLIYPTIDDQHGFPPEVNRAIALSPEMSEVTSVLVKNTANPIRQSLDTLYMSGGSSSPGNPDLTRIDGGTP